jgi:hypothetical protein
MQFNFKPFLDAIPSITSAYSLIAFVLVLLAATVFILLKSNSPIFKILEKKFTKEQSYKFISRIALYTFLFACFVFLLGYLTEFMKTYNLKTSQTSVIIFDKSVDISTPDKIMSSDHPGYLVASNPAFSIPAPDLSLWEKPVWVTDKSDLQNFFKISMPKEIDYSGPFFDFISQGRFLFLLSKGTIKLEINKSSSIKIDSPFESTNTDEYPFSEPMIINGRHHIGIISISKANVPNKFKTVNIAALVTFYFSELSLKPDKLIVTNNSAIITNVYQFKNAIYQGLNQDIKIFKCIRFIETDSHFFIIEGNCYAPDSNPDIRKYMLNVISKFGLPSVA